MAVAEIAGARILCSRCRRLAGRPGDPRTMPCRCRFVIDFYVGSAAVVWPDMDLVLASLDEPYPPF